MATEVIKIVDPDNGSGTDYTSLAAAVAGEARNLVTADEQLTIKCRCTGGTADGAVTIDGFTTDATRYVKVWTDPSESYRHAGTYPSGNKYRIEQTGGSRCISTQIQNAKIIGIPARSTASGTGSYASCFYTGVENGSIYYDKCIAFGSGGTQSGNFGWNCTSSNSTTIYCTNCIAYGFYKSGGTYYNGFRINATGTMYCYNCTSSGSTYGFKRDAGTVVIANSIGFNNYDDFYGTITINHCASDDCDGTNAVDISPGATEADDWAACFTDYANGDFSLKSDSVCVGAGVNDPSSGLYSDDILGNARTSPWDIGAFEYVSAGGGTTYDESISLSGSGSMAPFHALSIASAVNINAAAEQVNSTAISIISSLSMNANADNDLSPSANMLGGLMLATECGFSPSVVASLLSALDLKSAAALSPVGTLALTAATALSASAGLEAISSVGASTYGVALSLDAQAAIEQAAVNAIVATFGASAVAGIDAIPDYEIAAALSLQVDTDIQHVCAMAAQAMLLMGVGAEHMPSATAAFNASMALGVDAILQAITQSALPGSVAARVSRVLAENRIVRVASENRISRVARENRIVRA